MKGFPSEKVEIERRFSLTNVDGKNHKFWNIALLTDGTIVVHFGPQGKDGQMKHYPVGHRNYGRSAFDRLIAEKTSAKHENGAYTENIVLDTPVVTTTTVGSSSRSAVLRQTATLDIARGDVHLTELVTYLADVNAHNIEIASGGQITYNTTTGLFSTPQGVISMEQIHQARLVLDSIAVFSVQHDFESTQFRSKVGQYLSLVPQQGETASGKQTSLIRQMDFSRMFGREGLRGQGNILDSLEASNAAVAVPKTTAPVASRVFEVSLNLIPRSATEWQDVREHYWHCRGDHPDSRHLDVKAVYSLRIDSMAAAFMKVGFRIGNVWECAQCGKGLWHGTKVSNLLSMFKRGMIIPATSDPHVTGRMFGDGLYFADRSTKAIGYATGRYTGYTGHRIFMLCADVALGKPYHPRSTISRIPSGYNSCWAKPGMGIRTWGGNDLLNPELIVYDPAQANPVYLVEFSGGGR